MTEAEQTGAWLPLKEAAQRLGLSEKALRSRLVRRTLRSRRGNDGRVQVFVPDAPMKHAPEIHRALFGAEQTEASPAPVLAGLASLDDVRKLLGEQHDTLTTLHREALDRQERQYQAAMSLMLERVDRAELVADQAQAEASEAHASLRELVTRIMALPAPEPQQAPELRFIERLASWWRSWRGTTSTSTLRR